MLRRGVAQREHGVRHAPASLLGGSSLDMASPPFLSADTPGVVLFVPRVSLIISVCSPEPGAMWICGSSPAPQSGSDVIGTGRAVRVLLITSTAADTSGRRV
jgi:hypothetical protein